MRRHAAQGYWEVWPLPRLRYHGTRQDPCAAGSADDVRIMAFQGQNNTHIAVVCGHFQPSTACIVCTLRDHTG